MNSCCITLQVLTISNETTRTVSRCCFSYTDVRTSLTLEQELTLIAYGRPGETLSRCSQYDVVQVIGELWQVGQGWELVAKNCVGSVIPTSGSFPINHVCLIGNHGSDKYKDIKYFESGSALCKFGMAVDRTTLVAGTTSRQGGAFPKGERNTPTWFRVRAWGKVADVAANLIRPGDRMGVEGMIGLESYQGKQQLVVVASRLELLEPKPVTQVA